MARNYTYWQEPSGWYLGYLNDYPDYVTQGKDIPELEYMLGDILDAIRDGDLEDTAAKHSYGTLVHA